MRAGREGLFFPCHAATKGGTASVPFGYSSSDTNANWEKNEMAQRPFLPEMNELAVRLRHGEAMYKC